MQRTRNLILIPALLLMFSTAIAEDAENLKDLPKVSVAEESVLSLNAFEGGAALSDAELNTHRARENIEVDEITINDQNQDGDVEDNVAIGNTNGDNLINGEAFSNSSGFLSTVQNTGNNVLIQNSTIINVSVDAPTD